MSKTNFWENKISFKKEVFTIAKNMDLKIGTIFLRPMSRKWASVRSDGSRLYFDKKLIHMKKDLGRYVIVHELIHLKVPNHGKLFKSLLRTYVKDYSKLEKKLKIIASCRYN